MIQLRDYQQELVDKVRQAYRDGFKCPLVVASTGLGKTVIFSYITHGAAARDTPVLVAAHRKEIIRQISLSLARFGVEHQVIAPPDKVRQVKIAHFRAFGRSFVTATSNTMVGSVQTMVTRFDQIEATVSRTNNKPLIIMDEGHHVVEDTQWGRVMDRFYAQAGGRGLIVTASPERLDGRGLGAGHGGYADTMIEAPPMSWAIERGFLSPYKVFTTHSPVDLAGVRVRMGDYVASDVEERIDKPSITGDAIQHWRQHANGMRAVVFCVSVAHSQHVSNEFNAAGIPAAHIDGSIDDSDRDKAITDFADGKVLVLTQVNLVSEGFDLGSIAQKDVTIDCIIDLAPTKSLVNAMQRWGRALRPAPGKVAVLLDHAGNVITHGLPDAEREWSLEGRKKTKRAANDNDSPDVLTRTCPKCYAITKPVPVCPNCGHVHVVKERKVEEKEGQLVELTEEAKEALRMQARREQGRAQTREQLIAMGKSPKEAEIILAARKAKDELRAQAKAALADWHAKHRLPVKNVFGIFSADIGTMKPKALKELIARIAEDDEQRSGGGFSIAAVA